MSDEGHEMDGAPTRNWRSIRQLAELIWVKGRLDLKSRTSKTYLSYVWWVAEPLIYMVVFYVVFGLVLQRGGPDYIPYLLCGLIPFHWISKSLPESANSILNGKGLLLNVRIPPLFFPSTIIVASTLKQIPGFILLFLFMLYWGFTPGLHWAAVAIVILVQLLFIVSISFVVALAVPYVRDLTRLVPLVVQLLLFSSGIFYTTSRIPPEWHSIFFLNPVAVLLREYRTIFIAGDWPSVSGLGYVLIVSLGILALVFLFNKAFSAQYAKVVLQ